MYMCVFAHVGTELLSKHVTISVGLTLFLFSVENLVCSQTVEAGYMCLCKLSDTVTIPLNGTECISKY